MSGRFLPYGRQVIDEADEAAVLRALRSDFLTTGPEIPALEAEFAAFTGAPHAVACANGTAALHLALAGLGVGPGDVCIVPAITFAATANAALYCGAEVVFADVDPDSGLLTVDSFKAALERAGPAARAVLPVHLAGAFAPMPEIMEVAREAGLRIVEDSCHAFASVRAGGGMAGDGLFCDAATFSLHPVKTITSGEGGLVTTRDGDLAEAMRRLRSHGIERDPARFEDAALVDAPWAYEMQVLGFNHRLPDLNAALARSQLAKLPRFAEARRRLTALYLEALADLAPLVLPPAGDGGDDPCRHLMNVRIDFEAAGVDRALVMTRLRAAGIGSQVHYIPVSDQPFYRARYGRAALPGAARYYARTLSLPHYPGMTDDDPARVCEALARALRP